MLLDESQAAETRSVTTAGGTLAAKPVPQPLENAGAAPSTGCCCCCSIVAYEITVYSYTSPNKTSNQGGARPCQNLQYVDTCVPFLFFRALLHTVTYYSGWKTIEHLGVPTICKSACILLLLVLTVRSNTAVTSETSGLLLCCFEKLTEWKASNNAPPPATL